MGHAYARLDRLRKCQWRKVVAAGFNHQSDGLPMLDIEHALLYQVGIDGGIEPAVIDHIVDVAVGVVVHPARRDAAKYLVGAARRGLRFFMFVLAHGVRFCQCVNQALAIGLHPAEKIALATVSGR